MKVAKIPLKKVKIKKGQPRQEFDQEALDQLAGSIQEVGQLQPIIVKKTGDNYNLVAGERRYRAVKKNNEKEIAAIILDEGVTETTLRQIQLVENLQREDLNPLERAISIQRFIDENGLTKKDAGQKLGVPRTTLTEWLNILEVGDKYRQAVVDDDSPLSLSHITLAKALVSRTGDPTKQKELLEGILKYHLSRDETKQVLEIVNRYLHIPMEEAISAILLRREHHKVVEKGQQKKGSNKRSPIKGLINNLSNLGNKIEVIMEQVGNIDEEEKMDIIDEFLYIYQLLGIMIPELSREELDSIIEKIKNYM